MNEHMAMDISSPSTLTREMKSPTAFRTISEVADGLALPQHVLRFWESKFQEIKPLKRGGGRRYYRPEDVKIIHDIKELLYNQGFTIRGVQKLLREKGAASLSRATLTRTQVPGNLSSVQEPGSENESRSVHGTLSPEKRREIEGVLSELRSIRAVLQQTGI